MGKTEIQETGKTWTKSTKVSWRRMQTRAGLICSLGNGLRFCRLNNGSCMSREAHVQFCEGLAGKFRWSTLRAPQAHKGKSFKGLKLCKSCTRDGGKPSKAGLQGQALNNHELR